MNGGRAPHGVHVDTRKTWGVTCTLQSFYFLG